jgi:nitroreductase
MSKPISEAPNNRTADYEILPAFLERWSPRAMAGTPLSSAELMSLLEAARWAPSGGNLQPWRFVYGVKGTGAFDKLLECLADSNRVWCEQAGALIVMVSKTTRDNGQPNRTHGLDAGAAWMSLALQGAALGLVVHGMGGFDLEKAATAVSLPPSFEVQHMVAVGHPGSLHALPEKLQARELPSGRKPLGEIAFEGSFHSP